MTAATGPEPIRSIPTFPAGIGHNDRLCRLIRQYAPGGDTPLLGLVRVPMPGIGYDELGASAWLPTTDREAFAAAAIADLIPCADLEAGAAELVAAHPSPVLDRVFALLDGGASGFHVGRHALLTLATPMLCTANRPADLRAILSADRAIVVLGRDGTHGTFLKRIRTELGPTDFGLRRRDGRWITDGALEIHELVHDPVRRGAVRKAAATIRRRDEAVARFQEQRGAIDRALAELVQVLCADVTEAVRDYAERTPHLVVATLSLAPQAADWPSPGSSNYRFVASWVAAAEAWFGARAVRSRPEYRALRRLWKRLRPAFTDRRPADNVLTAVFGAPERAAGGGRPRRGGEPERLVLECLPRTLDALFDPKRPGGRPAVGAPIDRKPPPKRRPPRAARPAPQSPPTPEHAPDERHRPTAPTVDPEPGDAGDHDRRAAAAGAALV